MDHEDELEGHLKRRRALLTQYGGAPLWVKQKQSDAGGERWWWFRRIARPARRARQP